MKYYFKAFFIWFEVVILRQEIVMVLLADIDEDEAYKYRVIISKQSDVRFTTIPQRMRNFLIDPEKYYLIRSCFSGYRYLFLNLVAMVKYDIKAGHRDFRDPYDWDLLQQVPLQKAISGEVKLYGF